MIATCFVRNLLFLKICGLKNSNIILFQVQPIDMVKVRIQLKSEAKGASLNPFTTAREIFAEGGIRQFYKGYNFTIL